MNCSISRMVSLLLGCFIGFVTAMSMYAPTYNRKKQAIATTADAAYLKKEQIAWPPSGRPPCEEGPVLPSNFDYSLVESTDTSFWWNNGSFVLRYNLEGGEKLEIVMVGPDGSEEDPPGDVLWGLNPKNCEGYSKIDPEEILKFISRRLKTQTNLTSEEAGYLSTLLVYSLKLVRLKRWGFGSKHFREGEWYKVFERPETATFGNGVAPDGSPKD